MSDDRGNGADIELTQVRDFLAEHEPFDALPERDLRRTASAMAARYHRRGSAIMAVGQDNHDLIVVRSGAIEIRDADGGLIGRGAEGETLGTTTLVGGNPSRFSVTAIEDTLALHLPGSLFHELSGAHPAFADFFDEQRADRISAAARSTSTTDHGDAILKTSASDLARRAPITVTGDVSVAEAARVMTGHGVSSLLVVDGSEHDPVPGALRGILTDRDLRGRVLAAGIDPSAAVATVMTADPVTAPIDALAFELLLAMVERNIHHLPLVDADGAPVGVVTTTDLMRLERASAVHLVGDIAKQHDVGGVAAVAQRIPTLVEHLVAQDASASDITRIVTAVGDAVERRIIDLAISSLGPPPAPFCWMVLGSKARYEQALGSDQDHALILADDLPEGADEYFAELADLVVEGLIDAGYTRCPGDVMATNPRWRQGITAWQREFTRWVTEPTSDAVLTASIFFDSRALHGDHTLHTQLADHVISLTPDGKRFLAHLAKEAVANEPPLGFFRGFVLAKEGEHKDTLDLKRGGIGAIVDLARVHALAKGLAPVSTQARLLAAAAAGSMSQKTADNLIDALEFIAHVRLVHQARQVRAGASPDNHIGPGELTAFERGALRDAFQIVRAAQQALTQLFPLSVLS